MIRGRTTVQSEATKPGNAVDPTLPQHPQPGVDMALLPAVPPVGPAPQPADTRRPTIALSPASIAAATDPAQPAALTGWVAAGTALASFSLAPQANPSAIGPTAITSLAATPPKALAVDTGTLAIIPAAGGMVAALPASQAGATSPASAAAQLAPALIHIARDANGQQITLSLAPAELGRLDIRIDRAADGTASIQVLVERPETLKLLQADQSSLLQTLDKAGLPPEGRSLSLSLALPDAAAGFGGSFSDSQPGSNRHQRDGSASTSPGVPAGTTLAAPRIVPAWRRAGINITA